MKTHLIKEKIDNVMYYCFNILSDIVFNLKFKTKHLIKKNRKFKDKHLGERCFILGTGPSLNNLLENDIDNLKNEVVFAVNSIYKSKIVDEITPTYYSLFDNLYWDQEKHAFADILKKYELQKPLFLTDYRTYSIVKDNDYEKNTLFLFNKKFPITKIESCIDKNMYIGQNVVSTTILIAIFMGFKEIYLLGCDYNSFATQVGEHCYDDTDELVYGVYNLEFYLKFYALTTRIHYLIAKLAFKKGVKIINLTTGSLLDAYPREDISSVNW